jgi:hypothetical protein
MPPSIVPPQQTTTPNGLLCRRFAALTVGGRRENGRLCDRSLARPGHLRQKQAFPPNSWF